MASILDAHETATAAEGREAKSIFYFMLKSNRFYVIIDISR